MLLDAAHNLKAAGSNPAPATNKSITYLGSKFPFYARSTVGQPFWLITIKGNAGHFL